MLKYGVFSPVKCKHQQYLVSIKYAKLFKNIRGLIIISKVSQLLSPT